MEKSNEETSRYHGVWFEAANHRWTTKHCVNGKQELIGNFHSKKDAIAAHKKATAYRKDLYPPIVNLEGEEWLPLPEYGKQYMISNHGRLKSINYRRSGYPCLLKINYIRGYAHYILGKQRENVLMHRLVWRAFKGPIPNGLVINHKNRDKADNHISNLEMTTGRGNMHHWVVSDGGRVICWKKQMDDTWVAWIKRGKRNVYIGVYASEALARAGYIKKMKKLGDWSDYI